MQQLSFTLVANLLVIHVTPLTRHNSSKKHHLNIKDGLRASLKDRSSTAKRKLYNVKTLLTKCYFAQLLRIPTLIYSISIVIPAQGHKNMTSRINCKATEFRWDWSNKRSLIGITISYLLSFISVWKIIEQKTQHEDSIKIWKDLKTIDLKTETYDYFWEFARDFQQMNVKNVSPQFLYKDVILIYSCATDNVKLVLRTCKRRENIKRTLASEIRNIYNMTFAVGENYKPFINAYRYLQKSKKQVTLKLSNKVTDSNLIHCHALLNKAQHK